MADVRCRACEEHRGVELTVQVSRPRTGAMQWRVVVCRDCWRAWEAMLDAAAVGVQPGLSVPQAGMRWWFR